MNQKSNTPLVASIGAIILAICAFFVSVTHGVSTVVTSPNSVGALSGPEIPSPYITWGGVTKWNAATAFQQGTSTLCSIQAPAATSSLESVTMRFDTTPAYADVYEIGYSATTKNATTTALVASWTVPASATSNMQATTTLTTPAIAENIVAPNAWINFNVSTTTVGANGGPAGTGQCTAQFEQI